MIFYLFKKCTFLDLSFWARCSKRNCIHLPTFWTTRILNKIDETVFLDFVQQEAWYCDPWEKRSKWDEPSGASVYPQEVGSRLHAEQGTQRGTEDTLNWEYCSSPERPRQQHLCGRVTEQEGAQGRISEVSPRLLSQSNPSVHPWEGGNYPGSWNQQDKAVLGMAVVSDWRASNWRMKNKNKNSMLKTKAFVLMIKWRTDGEVTRSEEEKSENLNGEELRMLLNQHEWDKI